MLHMTSDISLKDVSFTKYEKVVDFLLNYMDINDRNAFGQTVLHRSGKYAYISKKNNRQLWLLDSMD